MIPVLIILGILLVIVFLALFASWLNLGIAMFFYAAGIFIWFMLVTVTFAYIWYYVGKWIYFIIINAKSFVERTVNWVLTIFE